MRAKLETKFLFLFLVALLFFFVGLWHKRSMDGEEMRAFAEDFNKHHAPLFKEISKLKSESFQALVSDYTFWDEMVDFIGTGDTTFSATYLDTALNTYRIDALWVYKTDRSLVYSVRKEKKGEFILGEGAPFPLESVETAFLNGERFIHFFVRSPKGVMEIRGATIHPGFDADRKTPAQGYFFVGRLWGRQFLRELSAVLGNSSLEIVTHDGEGRRAALYDARKDGIYFSQVLPGLDRKPVALLTVRTKAGFIRDFDEIAKKDLWVYVVIAFALFVSFYYAIRYWITAPMNVLSRALDKEDPFLLDPLNKGNAEFARLARMLKKSFEQKEILLREMNKRKEAEEERLKFQNQFLQSQKIESIGRLAGGIAHDFNNLLTVIIGLLDMRLDALTEGDPLKEDLEEARMAAHRAAELTQQLLAFSRRQILTMSPVDVSESVANLHKMLRRLIGEDIELVISAPPKPAVTRANRSQLEQVIINLAVNARDAMPKGGRLTINTSLVKLESDFFSEYVESKPGEYVLLSIQDTGHGMTPEVKAHLFEPFFSTKEKGKGTGLGLATCYGIVKQMGGYIYCDSEPDRGTTFRIYLPRVFQAKTWLPGQAKILSGLSGGSETVLLVEDERSVRQLSGRLLRQRGYRVIEASNGDEALRLARAYIEGPIHLLLTDVVMPRMDGKELSSKLKDRFPELKVLFTSGYTDDTIGRHGMSEAEIDFISKPFVPQGLVRKVREVLDK